MGPLAFAHGHKSRGVGLTCWSYWTPGPTVPASAQQVRMDIPRELIGPEEIYIYICI